MALCPVVMSLDLLQPFVSERFSPRDYDVDHVISDEEVAALIEAARWAPSAGNSQPWRFLVARRGDELHRRVVGHLAKSTAAWAPDASLLVVNLTKIRVEESDLTYSEFAYYDLGQAVAHLTFQAHALGLQVHQFRGFDRESLQAELGVPREWEVASLATVGVATADGGLVVRDRLPLEEVLWQPQRIVTGLSR